MNFRKHANPLLLITMLLAPAWVACSSTSESESNPYDGDPDAVDAGGVLFVDQGCADCHGADGAGTAYGPDIRGIAESGSDSEIFGIIQNGQNDMPDFSNLSSDEIWQLVTYMRSWSE